MKQKNERSLVMAVYVVIGATLGVILVRYSETGFILISVVGFMVGIIASLVLHELGHLLFGHLSGHHFTSFRLLNMLWVKDEAGKIRLKKSAGTKGIAGQCLMGPPADEKEFRFVMYNAGGALVNFITCAAFLIPAFFIENEILSPFLGGMGISALALGILNIVPLSLGGYPNDGKNFIEAKRSPDAKHGFYMLLKSNSEMSKGKRLSDYDEDAFYVNENADKSNHFVAMMIIMRSSQLEEIGDFRQSYRELQRLDLSKLPPIYGHQVIFSMIFHELVYFGDEPSVNCARERFESKIEDKLFQNLLKMKHSSMMLIKAAIKAFLDNDVDNAWEFIGQARKLMSSLQNPGMEYSIGLAIDRLEARLK
jgi:hypothetical protein